MPGVLSEYELHGKQLVVMMRPWVRWVPAAAVPAVIATVVVAAPFAAGADSTLPPKSPAEVVALAAGSDELSFTGTVEQTSKLGLPELDLPGSPDRAALTQAIDLLTGTHTARVYLDGPDKARLQVMDELGERDVVRNGNDVWVYTFADNTAVHFTRPEAPEDKGQHEERVAPGEVATPADLAQKFLDAIDLSTEVTVGNDISVAGRPAYTLILAPETSGTLIESVSIAVDGATGLPLGVDITSNSQTESAFSVAFTELALEAPGSERFQPPNGATIQEETLPGHSGALPDYPPATGPEYFSDHDAHPGSVPSGWTISGTGWATVVGIEGRNAASALQGSPLLQAAEAVDGGRLISTALVNVLLTDDGRVFAGSVPLKVLLDVSASSGQ